MKKYRLIFLIFGVLLSSLTLNQIVYASTAPVLHESLSPILKPIMPAVVNIAAQGEIMVPLALNKRGVEEDRNNQPGSPASPYGSLREFASLGSGVIIDAKKGYILTNAHVIDKAKTITVTLSDGRNFKAKLIGADPESDIAVIKITPDNLIQMPIGNSDHLQVGDYVIAVGNPFGLTQTVTSGIVSALQRGSLGIEGPQGLENFIQTDASINPGNSGGALINLGGQLIGINTAILSPGGENGGNVGIGFAIPINLARVITAQLIEYGAVKRGLMGILVQSMTPNLATAFNINPSEKGAVISQITPDSPAQKAGLQPGDIIQKLNNQAMETAADVRNAVGLLRVGATINVQVLRHNKTVNLQVVTADPEQYIDQAQKENPFLFGLSLRDFDQQVPLQGHIIGVQIVRLSKSSTAWRAGLIPGDVIVSANQQPVKNIIDLQKIAAIHSDHLLLNVLRRGGALFIALDK